MVTTLCCPQDENPLSYDRLNGKWAQWFRTAQRFAACQNKEFLEALVRYYKMHVQFGKTDTLIPEMFKMLDV